MWNNSHFQLPPTACAMCWKVFTPRKWATRTKYCSNVCSNFASNSKKYRIVDDKKIPCAICWRYFTKPWAHVYNYHWMTARKYREQYGFDVKRGQVTDEHRELLASNVVSNGTIENLKVGERYRFKQWCPVPKYKRSKQTLERLKNLNKK